MVTWANRLMFYTTYMHQNMNLLLNKAANLCLYDQTCAIVGCWQHNLLPHLRNSRDSEGSEEHPWVMGTAPAGHPEAQVPQSGPSKPPVLQLILLKLHFKLFHWTLLHTQHIEDIFTFLHEVCRPVHLFMFKIFLIKIVTYLCHVVS